LDMLIMLRIPTIDDGALPGQNVLDRGASNADHITSAEVMSGTYALFALDCMSPAAIGHAVLSAIRTIGLDTLVLDADVMSKVEERIRGLRALGAGHLDQSRVGAAPRTKRPDQAVETALRIGPLELDLLKREATHSGHTLDLRPTALRVLECLMRRADQVVTRTVIFEDVWNCHFDPHTNRIDVHVGQLRRLLAARSTGPRIHTFRGAGYMLR
jgi:two-component system, OmpR family, response regulator